MTQSALADVSSAALNQAKIPLISNDQLTQKLDRIRAKMDRRTYDNHYSPGPGTYDVSANSYLREINSKNDIDKFYIKIKKQ